MRRLMVGLLTGLALVVGGAAGEDPAEQVRAVLETTGFTDSIQGFPAMARAQAAQGMGGDDALGRAFGDALAEALAPGAILAAVQERLVEHYAPAHARAILDWYAEPLGQRVRAATEALNTPAAETAAHR